MTQETTTIETLSKTLQWRIQKQNLHNLPIKEKTQPRKNTRGTITDHHITIGPLTPEQSKTLTQILQNTTHYTQTILQQIQQYTNHTEQIHTRQTNQIIADQTLKTAHQIQQAQEQHQNDLRDQQEQYQQKLHKEREKNKLLIAILVAPQLIPKIHNPQHFEPPKYYHAKTTPDHLTLTTNDIENPQTEPTAIWTAHHTMRNILTPPTKTTLYTTWPNIIYHKNKYHLLLTTHKLTIKQKDLHIPLKDLHKIKTK